MKRILVVINNLECGGIQKALIDLLGVLVGEYQVYLRCFSQGGAFLDQIPPEVIMLPDNEKLCILAESKEQLKRKSLLKLVKKGYWSILARLIGAPRAHDLFYRGITEDEYDIAISYTQDVSGYSFSVGCNDYVRKCVPAKKKLAFIHCDFANYGGNDPLNRKRYSAFDSIVCVSSSCKRVFDSCCPEYHEKSTVLYNPIDEAKVLQFANDKPYCYDERYVNFITVARLSKEKGILRGLRAMKKAMAFKNNIRWYIIGDGSEMKEAREYISRNDLSASVVLLGELINPYRYMKKASCLLVPSYHECAPVVFSEANILHLPVLTTETLSAVELIQNRNIGWVCKNTESGLVDGIMGVTNKLENGQKSELAFEDYTPHTLDEFDCIIERST